MAFDVRFNEREQKFHAVFGNNSAPWWNRPGVIVMPGLLTFDEALKHARLDYTVEKVPAFYEKTTFSEKGVGTEYREAPGCYLTIGRFEGEPDQVLGHVGEQYTVVQNREAFGILEHLVDPSQSAEKAKVIDAAGALGNGERVWFDLMIPDLIDIRTGKGIDSMYPHLLFYNSHDGSSGVSCRFVVNRSVCANTVMWNLGAKTPYQVNLRHTSNVQERLEEAGRLMGVARRGYIQVGEAFNAMAGKKLTKDQRNTFIMDVLDVKATVDVEGKVEISTRQQNILNKVGYYLESDPIAEPDSVWGVFNAITSYVDHSRTVRSTKKANGSASINSIWFGSGAKLKEQAFVKAVKLVKAS